MMVRRGAMRADVRTLRALLASLLLGYGRRSAFSLPRSPRLGGAVGPGFALVAHDCAGQQARPTSRRLSCSELGLSLLRRRWATGSGKKHTKRTKKLRERGPGTEKRGPRRRRA
eukprot:2482422-Prymnesium_polylepis.3